MLVACHCFFVVPDVREERPRRQTQPLYWWWLCGTCTNWLLVLGGPRAGFKSPVGAMSLGAQWCVCTWGLGCPPLGPAHLRPAARRPAPLCMHGPAWHPGACTLPFHKHSIDNQLPRATYMHASHGSPGIGLGAMSGTLLVNARPSRPTFIPCCALFFPVLWGSWNHSRSDFAAGLWSLLRQLDFAGVGFCSFCAAAWGLGTPPTATRHLTSS